MLGFFKLTLYCRQLSSHCRAHVSLTFSSLVVRLESLLHAVTFCFAFFETKGILLVSQLLSPNHPQLFAMTAEKPAKSPFWYNHFAQPTAQVSGKHAPGSDASLRPWASSWIVHQIIWLFSVFNFVISQSFRNVSFRFPGTSRFR
jgi:hypothetical protein